MKAHLLIALVALTWQTTPAFADQDYDLDPETWNGLGYLLTTATEAKVTLSTPERVDLGALVAEDIVFVIYPRDPLPVTDLLAFVEAGGYLLVADDRGRADELFEAVGLSRLDDGPTSHNTLWQGLSGFTRLSPMGEHFLFFNIEEVVANHPAALTLERRPDTASSSRIPVLSFEGGQEHLLVEVNHGRGKLIAIADASIFINDMLRRFYGDKQLAANLLRYPCLEEPCRATLVLPGRGFEGRFDSEKARLGSVYGDVAELIAMLNQAIAEGSRALSEPARLRWVATLVLLVLLVLMYRMWLMGRTRPRQLSAPIAHTPSSPMLDEVKGLLAQAHEGDFAALAPPLANLGVDLAKRHRLHELAHRPEPPTTPPDPEDEALRAALIRVESEAVGLRSREAGLWSAERLMRLHADIETLKRAVARTSPRSRTRRPAA